MILMLKFLILMGLILTSKIPALNKKKSGEVLRTFLFSGALIIFLSRNKNYYITVFLDKIFFMDKM